MKYRKPVSATLASTDPGAMSRRNTSGTLGPDIQAKIGKQLRAYYDGLIEPIPERFVELLRRLDEAGGKEAKGRNGAKGSFE
jgi:Anti-sigma factor NepR